MMVTLIGEGNVPLLTWHGFAGTGRDEDEGLSEARARILYAIACRAVLEACGGDLSQAPPSVSRVRFDRRSRHYPGAVESAQVGTALVSRLREGQQRLIRREAKIRRAAHALVTLPTLLGAVEANPSGEIAVTTSLWAKSCSWQGGEYAFESSAEVEIDRGRGKRFRVAPEGEVALRAMAIAFLLGAQEREITSHRVKRDKASLPESATLRAAGLAELKSRQADADALAFISAIVA